MKIESATRNEAEITWKNGDIFKLGPYSYRNIHDKKSSDLQQRGRKTPNSNPMQCYNFGNNVKGSIIKHKSSWPARNSKCYNCQLTGHFSKLCKSKNIKKVEQLDNEKQPKAEQMKYIVLIFLELLHQPEPVNTMVTLKLKL